MLFFFLLKTIFASVDKTKFKNDRVHFRNSGVKGLRKKSPLGIKALMSIRVETTVNNTVIIEILL